MASRSLARDPVLRPYFPVVPSPKYIHLGPGLLSSALLLYIPRHVRCLRLEHYSDCPFSSIEVGKLVSRAGRRELSLQSLVIYLYGPEDTKSRFGGVGELCLESGIGFGAITVVKSHIWWIYNEPTFSERLQHGYNMH